MKVIYGIGRLKIKKKSCIAIGVFDGVHRGHQEIIKKTVSIAKKKRLLSIVVTFHPHPDLTINKGKNPYQLTSLNHRLNIIRSLGIDICVVVRFNSRFRQLSANDFVSKFLIKYCKMKDLVVNKTFVFGKNREGDYKFLQILARKINFTIHFQKALTYGRKIISSTLIRSLIKQGDLNKAALLLGRSVEVMGTVVGGDMRGRKLGFPTANIDPHHEVIPPKGVYLVKAILENNILSGLANIGSRPTFSKKKNKIIELHLLDFKGDIYGKDVRVIFINKLRSEKRFKNKALLIEQINIDIHLTRKFFSL